MPISSNMKVGAVLGCQEPSLCDRKGRCMWAGSHKEWVAQLTMAFNVWEKGYWVHSLEPPSEDGLLVGDTRIPLDRLSHLGIRSIYDVAILNGECG